MGNRRFKLSDMLPIAWFYKLKGIASKRRRQTPPPPSSTSTTNNPPPSSSANSFRFSYPRKSYYFTRDFNPRKSNSSYQTKRKTNTFSSSVSTGCSSCRASTLWTNKSSDSPSIPPPPDYSVSSSSYSSADDSFRSDRIIPTESFDKMVAWSSCDKIEQSKADADDIIISVDCKPLSRDFDKLDLSDLDLPPIITKTVIKFDDKVEDMKKIKKQQKQEETAEKLKHRKSSAGNYTNNASLDNSNKRQVHSPRLRLRVNSPRIGLRRTGGGRRGGRKNLSSSPRSSSRRSLADSLAIVKASFDPQKDFRESMVEMIVENNIKASKDLEDLLACYLSLNSDEYHDLIINVFKQIWLDLSENPAK